MGTVTANGIDISFDVHGVGDRGTVLLICGTGQSAAMWTALGTTGGLTDAGYQVVTFDNRGMAGAACPAPPWTVGDMADDALAVLQAVGPADVLGASLGALVTQTVALRRPGSLRTATFMIGGGQFGPAWACSCPAWSSCTRRAAGLPEGIERFMMLQAFLTPEQRGDPAMVELALALTSGLTDGFGPGGQHGQYSACAAWVGDDHVGRAADVQAPVLVLANEPRPGLPGTRPALGRGGRAGRHLRRAPRRQPHRHRSGHAAGGPRRSLLPFLAAH